MMLSRDAEQWQEAAAPNREITQVNNQYPTVYYVANTFMDIVFWIGVTSAGLNYDAQ